MPKSQSFEAVEDPSAVREAIDIWEDKFRIGAEPLARLGGVVALWHERLGIWGHFSNRALIGETANKFSNPFGRDPHRLRQNTIVSINPGMGASPNVVGLIAIDSNGDRWILHRGRLHPSNVRITEAMFDEAAPTKRASVKFTDTSTVGYHCVANLESDPTVLQAQLAEYIVLCDRVRLYHMAGVEVARQDEKVAIAEGSPSPERQGSYALGPQPAKIAVRRHADVWHALTKALDKLGTRHTNARVGRHGPDLRTIGKSPTLFEIKSDCEARDVQQAVGQLLLYEQFLGVDHRKVLVIPAPLNKQWRAAIANLKLKTLLYSRSGRTVSFEPAELQRVLR
jgi:hypothetical protein